MTRVTITLETPLAEALRAEALREDRPVSSVARRAFARYFTLAARGPARAVAGAATDGTGAEAAGVCAAPAAVTKRKMPGRVGAGRTRVQPLPRPAAGVDEKAPPRARQAGRAGMKGGGR